MCSTSWCRGTDQVVHQGSPCLWRCVGHRIVDLWHEQFAAMSPPASRTSAAHCRTRPDGRRAGTVGRHRAGRADDALTLIGTDAVRVAPLLAGRREGCQRHVPVLRLVERSMPFQSSQPPATPPNRASNASVGFRLTKRSIGPGTNGAFRRDGHDGHRRLGQLVRTADLAHVGPDGK